MNKSINKKRLEPLLEDQFCEENISLLTRTLSASLVTIKHTVVCW